MTQVTDRLLNTHTHAHTHNWVRKRQMQSRKMGKDWKSASQKEMRMAKKSLKRW